MFGRLAQYCGVILFGVSIASFGCKGEVTDAGPGDPGAVEVELDASSLKRLTRPQYHNSLRDIFGDDVVVPTRLEPDIESNGSIAHGAAKTTISPRGVELYESAAFDVALQVSPRASEWTDCAPGTPDDPACYRELADELGTLIWRRPLDEAELDRVAQIGVTSGTTLGSWQEGAEFVIAALLQSPHFLFRSEVGEVPDGDRRRLDSFELASRLAFFFWNAGPDAELLDAASSGRLDTAAGLEEEVDRLVADPRSRRGVRAFFSDLLGLHRLEEIAKAPEIFPHFSSTFAESARKETLMTLEHHVFEERADFRDVLTTRTTFLNRELAAAYGVRAPAKTGFERYEFSEDSPRSGILGHASLLSLHSHPVATSPTLRGIFIRTKLLCQRIPPPPSNVDTSIPEATGDAPTLRERIERHLEDPACSSCHTITDPIGLGLENFDGVGRYRETENGHPIDSTGELDGAEFEGLESLARAIRDHDRFTPCFTQNLYTYATGHELTSDDQELVDVLEANFAAADYDVIALMRAIVRSPGFRYAGNPSDAHMTAGGEQ